MKIRFLILNGYLFLDLRFESSVKSYMSKTLRVSTEAQTEFESSVKSYMSKT